MGGGGEKFSYKNYPPPKKKKKIEKNVAKVFVLKHLELVSLVWDCKVLTPLSNLSEKHYGLGQYVSRPDCLSMVIPCIHSPC